MIKGVLWGYVLPTGKFYIPPTFKNAWPFRGGFATAKAKGMRDGIIDIHGEFLTEPRFEMVNHPDETGVFPAKLDDKWGYYDLASDDWRIPPSFEAALSFESGRAFAAGRIGDKLVYGLIDTSGHYVVQPKWSMVSASFANVAYAQTSILEEGHYFIDRDGNHILGPYKIVDSGFYEGVAIVRDHRLLPSRLIDMNGNTIWESDDWSPWGLFTNGVAVVTSQNGLGIVDLTGHVTPVPGATDIWTFSEGYAGVKINDKIGIIDKDGQITVNPKYERGYWHMSHGLFPVRLNEKWGFVNSRGDVVIDFQFEAVRSFSSGLAAVAVKDE